MVREIATPQALRASSLAQGSLGSGLWAAVKYAPYACFDNARKEPRFTKRGQHKAVPLLV